MGKNASKPEIQIKEVFIPVEKNEIINEYDKIDEIPKFDYFEEEINYLLKKKKEVLESQLYLVKENLKNYKDINHLVEELYKYEENYINNKAIDDKEKYCCCLYNNYLFWNFNFIGLLFVIFNLIGVFQLIWLFKASGKELTFGIKSFLFEKNRTNSTEYIGNNFENYSFNNIPDFNLFFVTSILGNILLKAIGFTISSIIYMFVNSTILIFFRSFNFNVEKYNFYEILIIFVYFVLIFISVGSISLFPHQIYFDGLTKYLKFRRAKEGFKEDEDYKKDDREIFSENISDKNDTVTINISKIKEILKKRNKKYRNKEKQISFFPYLCLTVIPAYLINVGINYFLKQKQYFNNYFLVCIFIYILSAIISLIFYRIYSSVFIKGDKKQKDEKIIKVCRILGYLIYCEKKLQTNKKEKNEEENGKKKENNDNSCCYSFRLGLRKYYYESEGSFLGLFASEKCEEGLCCACCCFKYCCCCCPELELSEINQGDEQFCYIYKVQRKFSWFCDLLFKNKILDKIFLIFF